jgi:hypothetical protein
MSYRIGTWASVGFLVGGWWALYYAFAAPIPMGSTEPITALVRLTCPISLLSFYPLRLYWVLLANAATYAMIGLIVESLKLRLHHAN